MRPDYHALTLNEVQPAPDSFGQKSPYKHVRYYIQAWRIPDCSKDLLVEENNILIQAQHIRWAAIQNFGGKPVSTIARREESLRRGRRQLRLDIGAKPDLDHSVSLLALLRLSGGSAPERED